MERTVNQLREKIRAKIAASRRETGRDFRLEQLCAALSLERFEKYCLLEMLKTVIAPQGDLGNSYMRGRSVPRFIKVGRLIESFCSTGGEDEESPLLLQVKYIDS